MRNVRENAAGAGIPVSGFTGWIPRDDWLTNDEQRAIIKFHCDRLLEGCRRLAWVMTDAGIVTSSPGIRGNLLCPCGTCGSLYVASGRAARGRHQQLNTPFPDDSEKSLLQVPDNERQFTVDSGVSEMPCLSRVHTVRAGTMISAVSLSEADILEELVRPDDSSLSLRVAEELLAIGFSSSAKEAIRELLQKNNSGTITDAEKETLQNYTRVGQFLDLLQAKARLSLMQSGTSL